jgi:hypothetical protein
MAGDTPADFNGPAYDPAVDQARLSRQHERIRDLMADGQWRTLAEISTATADPQSSVSAQLRHLRKKRFGSYVVAKRARGDRAAGLYEYRVSPPEDEALPPPPPPLAVPAAPPPAPRPAPRRGDARKGQLALFEK